MTSSSPEKPARSPSAPPPASRSGLTIRAKVVVCGALLVAVLLGTTWFVVAGLNRVSDSFEEYGEVTKLAAVLVKNDQTLTELERHTLMYSFTANASSPVRVEELGAELLASIAEARTLVADEEPRYRLDQMQARVEAYLANFTAVVEERQTRLRLLRETLLPLAEQIEAALAEPLDAEEAGLPERLRLEFAQVKNTALLFLNDPDSEKVTLVVRGLKALRSDVSVLSETEEDVPADLARMLQRFGESFNRLAQATRSYLHVVGVVMAGEAAEATYHSGRLREWAEESSSAIRSQSVAASSTARTKAVVTTVASTAIAVAIGALLLKIIVGPITEMTATFERLSEGERVERIPGLARADEIGRMALAADVFRRRNAQTLALLDEARRLADELDAQTRKLEQSNADLDSFAYVASHDLKSPLRAIDNLSMFISEDLGDDIPPDVRENIDELRRRVRRMERLLDDLLDYSRANRHNATFEEIDIVRTLEEIRGTVDWPEDMTLTLPEKRLTVITHRGPFERTLLNLITNATKYRAERDPEVVVEAESEGDFVHLCVRDNGPGIDPQFHEQIFQMFKRLHTQSEVDGSGMGLALIKKLVKTYGGRIWVESELKQGAAFHFTWPKEPLADEDVEDREAAEHESSGVA